MKNSQRGFVGVVLIIIIALGVAGGGAYLYSQKQKTEVKLENQNTINTNFAPTSGSTIGNSTTTHPEIAKIRAYVNNIRAGAEIYFDTHNNTYVGICTDQNTKTYEALMKKADVYCNASVSAYVYSARQPTGDFWCVDKINYSGIAIKAQTTGLSCK